MSKIIKAVCFCLLLAVFFASFPAKALSTLEIQSTAALVVDAASGDVLFEKNADKKMFPASTTKMMTALLALENCPLDEEVTVSESALSGLYESGSAVNLVAGETLTIRQLVYYLLVASGNDAANVLAEHISGNTSAFAQLMTDRAKELGCLNTNFVNPHGLHDENHYTTARDLYKIALKGMENEAFRDAVSQQKYVLEPNDVVTSTRTFYTTNHLISRWRNVNYLYDKAIGIKTGFTTPAGHCLVSAAQAGNSTYYCVILGAPEGDGGDILSFSETIKLFDWAFANFKTIEILQEKESVAETPVAIAKERDFVVLVPQRAVSKLMPSDVSKEDITREIALDENIKAPVQKGQTLGSVTLSYDGKTIDTVPLVASSSLERSTPLYIVDLVLSFFKSTVFRIVLAIVLALFILFVVYVILINRYKRGKRRRYRRINRRR